MISKMFIAGGVTVAILLGAIFRTEDAECLWLLWQKTDMFSDLKLLPQADRVAISLLPMPSNASKELLYRYALDTLEFESSESISPRQKALEFLHANPITPNFLLKLRLKEIALCCHIMRSHDPNFGSHFNEVQVDYIDQL